MANRVLMGQRGSQYGLWVSKPGQNVLTAPDNQLLFNSNNQLLQVLYSVRRSVGVVSPPNNYTDFSWVNPGYRAFCWVTSNSSTSPRYTWLSNSSIRVTYNQNAAPMVINVIVFNVPVTP